MSTRPNTLEIERIDALTIKARNLRDSDPMQSAAVATEALTLACACNPPDELGIAKSHYHLAIANHEQMKIEEALEHASAALNIYNELMEPQGEFDCT